MLFSAAAAQAGGGREQIKLTATGQAAARAVLMTNADLANESSWTGGATKPALAKRLPCPAFQPKQSDLVVVGAAEVKYQNRGLQFDNEVQVFKTARMVRLDWQRTVNAQGFLQCLRTTFASKLGALGAGAKLVSVKRLALPPIARYTIGYRTRIDAGKPTRHVFIDILLFGKGRTEVSLATTSFTSLAIPVGKAELTLARRRTRRIRV